MPELVLALMTILIALLRVVVTAGRVGAATGRRPDPLEEAAAAQRAALTAADTARASARAAHVAELAEFDAEARRILDALDVPCVCSQVSTHEWDERTQSYRQRWTVPEHFTACAKHWPATTGAPPAGTVTARPREGGPLLTPAARVDAERARYAAAMLREYATTTYGVPDGCTCVPDHARAALANTHVLHRVGCAANRGPHAAEWRPMGDNG